MGKNKRKRNNQHALFHAAKARMLLEAEQENKKDQKLRRVEEEVVAEDVDASEEDIITDAALQTTLETLQKLVHADPTLESFRTDKRYKDLRRTLHPLVTAQLQAYDKGVDYRQRVSHALQHQRWSDALAALEGCRDFQQIPKQGTVQRWVRDCTTAGGSQVVLLQSILKTSSANSSEVRDASNKHDPGQALAEQLAAQKDKTNDADEEMTVLEGWKWWEDGTNDAEANVEESPVLVDPVKIESKILYREAAADRTPPNHYDLHLHMLTTPNAEAVVKWSTPPPPTACHAVPFLPTPSRVVGRALTASECQQILHVTNTLGYRPDHPVARSQPTGIDSCEWWVAPDIMEGLLERVRPHLPETLTLPSNSGSAGSPKQVYLHSINPRWRCFRYQQDCEYRPHLDGSWPYSYINPETGEYVCPSNKSQQSSGTAETAIPANAMIKSYLTCLVYLNDDFEGGETRFYLPSGCARGIVPKTGSIAIFPQGNTASLIHEGTKVTKGTKYVVRTDVLYATQPPAVDGDGEDEAEEETGNDKVESGSDDNN